MNKMLYLHSPNDGSVVLINADHILSVGKDDDSTIVVVHTFRNTFNYYVRETPEEVYKRLCEMN